jgi:hypothetical protein
MRAFIGDASRAGFFIASEMISQTYRHLVPDSEDFLGRVRRQAGFLSRYRLPGR